MSEMYENVFENEYDGTMLPEEKKYRSSRGKRIALSVVFIALSVGFSFFSVIDPNIENILLPAHIPVLIGSFVCGGPLGFIIGLVSPVIKYFIDPAQTTFLMTLCSCFELAVCGCVGGYLFRSFQKKWPFYCINVFIALLVSKIAFFILNYLLTVFFNQTDLTLEVFISNNLVPSFIGIACQMIIIPTVVVIFQKARIAFVY